MNYIVLSFSGTYLYPERFLYIMMRKKAGWHKSLGILQNWHDPKSYPQSVYVEIFVKIATKMPKIIFCIRNVMIEERGLRTED